MRAGIANKAVWLEGLVLVTIGLVSAAESIRLVAYKDPHMQVDWLGPGYYLLAISVCLLVTAIVYIYNHRKEPAAAEKKISKEMRIRLIGSFVTCAIYLVLIEVIGYLIGTMIFFAAMFKIVGIRSWAYNVVLSIAFSVVYYVVFVAYFGMVFPKGYLV